jgi:hypothetical protein
MRNSAAISGLLEIGLTQLFLKYLSNAENMTLGTKSYNENMYDN